MRLLRMNKKSPHSDLSLKELESFILGLVKDHHRGLTKSAFIRYKSGLKTEAIKHAERLFK